ncbi:MAG: hypothetical protein M3R36_14300 [Bacteroidota bacterium]|nr:hypothetical protein [Bacteroidota bacterium]
MQHFIFRNFKINSISIIFFAMLFSIDGIKSYGDSTTHGLKYRSSVSALDTSRNRKINQSAQPVTYLLTYQKVG